VATEDEIMPSIETLEQSHMTQSRPRRGRRKRKRNESELNIEQTRQLRVESSVSCPNSIDLIETWRPYVDGEIKVHRIACTHGTMMEPLPAAKIGTVLTTELAKHRTSLDSKLKEKKRGY
jgi:thioesterase domain-containing protein